MREKKGYLSAVLIFIVFAACIIPGIVSAGYFWSQSGYLNTGKSVTYQIQVNCGAQLVLTSPNGAIFNLYATRNLNGNSLTESQIRSQSDISETSSSHSKYINLDKGDWYVVVFAHSGYGQFQTSATNTCNTPAPTVLPTEVPQSEACVGNACTSTSCAPSATDVKTASLNPGEVKTYTYQISADRNYIEWVLTGPCASDVIPMGIMSAKAVSSLRENSCGSAYALYIYKDCDPRSQTCTATKADTSDGSNKYVGITSPATGSKYYALVYAKSGSGSYTLTTRSYKCQDDVIAMMKQKPELVSMMSTDAEVNAPVSVLGTS